MTARRLDGLPSPPRGPWQVRRGWVRSVRRRPRRSSSWRSRLRWLTAPLALLAVAALAWLPVQRCLYPLRFSEALRQQSLAQGLQPSLVAAVVLHESQFRPEAMSRAGAVGLMQLLPSTARWVADREGYGKLSGTDLERPELNLALGTAYLGHLQSRFGGDRVAALAAYNAGPENVQRWKGAQMLQLSRIPFPETRHYVRRVLRSQVRYQQLYPDLDRR